MAKIDDRCANCGGKFGLVCHRHWRLRFCSKVCKTNFLAKTTKDYAGMRKWFGLLAPAAMRSRPHTSPASGSCDHSRAG
jgi:hypothetical protein